MSENKLVAEPRNEFGKGAARRIRRAARVPAVLYGHGTDPVHLSLPGHETLLALRQANALLTIEIEGTSQLALPKQVQRDPITGFIEHVDLLLVRQGEKVSVDVAIHTTGDAAPDTLVVIENNTISVEASATHIPEQIEVNIQGLRAGSQVLAKDLVLPGDVSLGVDEDLLIVNVTGAPTEEQVEAELAEAEADLGIEPTIDEASAAAAEDEAAEGEGDSSSDDQ